MNNNNYIYDPYARGELAEGECGYQEHAVLDFCRAPASRFVVVDGRKLWFCNEHYGDPAYHRMWESQGSTVEY